MFLEIASHAPKGIEDLAATRGLGRGFAEGWQGREVLEAIERGRSLPEAELPTRDKPPEQLRAPSAVVDLLRTLLRLKADQADVAARLVASADELVLEAEVRQEGDEAEPHAASSVAATATTVRTRLSSV